jgi:hypothetical protein
MTHRVRNGSSEMDEVRMGEDEKQVVRKGATSKREYEVDAQALKTEEGRGDRRNVQGELHASAEP